MREDGNPRNQNRMSERAHPNESLLPQPGQSDSYNPTFHPLPGQWAQDQLNGVNIPKPNNVAMRVVDGSVEQGTELSRALKAEKAQHDYWLQYQGVIPGKPVYADPREIQNTLLPRDI
jgi:hypothetical protein